MHRYAPRQPTPVARQAFHDVDNTETARIGRQSGEHQADHDGARDREQQVPCSAETFEALGVGTPGDPGGGLDGAAKQQHDSSRENAHDDREQRQLG